MNKFLVRLVSGLAVGIVAIAAILWNKYSFFAVMSVALIGCLNEYFNITEPRREKSTSFFTGKWFVIILCFIAYAKSFVLASPPESGLPQMKNLLLALFQVMLRFRDSGLAFTAIIPILMFILFIAELYSKSEKPFENLGWKAIAVFWIAAPVILTNNIYFQKGGAFVLAMFMIIWVYDSFAYILGSLLGKKKLFERISPQKTWGGAVGGAVVTLAASYFIHKIPQLQMFSSVEWVILAFVIIVTATYGDLFESLLKRELGLKDSGSFMPGHGGFLDRLDSFFLVVPFVFVTLWLMGQIQNLMLVFEYLNS